MPSKPKQYKVIWSDIAEQDLEAIVMYIAKDSPNNALKVFANIKKQCENLDIFPNRGHIVPELKKFNILQYLQIIIEHWRVIYKIVDKQVFVLSVIDSFRNVEDILLERFTYSNK